MVNVYIIKNKKVTKNYIGITTKSINERFKVHILNANRGQSGYLYNAFRKYSSKNFVVEKLREVNTWQEACLLEIDYIKKYNTFGSKGYNMTEGGDGFLGTKHSADSRKRISEGNKKKKYSIESKKKMSLAHLGKKLSNETKQKMSLAHLGYNSLNNGIQTIMSLSELKLKCRKLAKMKGIAIGDVAPKKRSNKFSASRKRWYLVFKELSSD